VGIRRRGTVAVFAEDAAQPLPQLSLGLGSRCGAQCRVCRLFGHRDGNAANDSLDEWNRAWPDTQLADAKSDLIEKASRLLAERPALREKLIEVRRSYTQVLDETSKDEVIDAGFSVDATDRGVDLLGR